MGAIGRHWRFVALLYMCLAGWCVGETLSPSAEAADHANVEEHAEGGVDELTFFVVVLVIGVATYHVLVVTRVPYTAMLIVRPYF